jgi:GTP-binding protein
VDHHRGSAAPVAREVAVVLGYRGLERLALDAAGPGEIVAVAGVEAVRAGDRLAAPGAQVGPAPFLVDEPVLEIPIEVNDSPTAGVDGPHVRGAELRERLWREILTNDGVRIEETDSPDAFRLAGRGELQLVMLVEMMRREGYEMLAGRPRVLVREEGGRRKEPMEALVLDCPEGFVGVVTAKAGARRARLTKMVNHGTGRVRLEFRAPARGLIGFRAEFLSDTKGSGILNHRFDGYDDWAGEIPARVSGSLVADRAGRASGRAIEHLQGRGTIFVAPGDQVYRGMIVGENSKSNDLAVDVTKSGREVRAEAGAPRAAALIPPRSMSLEQALEFVRDDERVEVTPRALRLRKKDLRAGERP